MIFRLPAQGQQVLSLLMFLNLALILPYSPCAGVGVTVSESAEPSLRVLVRQLTTVT